MIIREVTFETLHVLPFICGPIENNTYAVFDEKSISPSQKLVS